MEYREIFLTLLRKYDETKQPQSYLKDLVESTHLFLRMLERFCKGRKNLMVQVSDAERLRGLTSVLEADQVLTGSSVFYLLSLLSPLSQQSVASEEQE